MGTKTTDVDKVKPGPGSSHYPVLRDQCLSSASEQKTDFQLFQVIRKKNLSVQFSEPREEVRQRQAHRDKLGHAVSTGCVWFKNYERDQKNNVEGF